jgi:predicted nucleic acid-binding protein
VRAFVDTNVLVYLYDRDDSHKRTRARELLLNDDLDLVISTQVLAEFFVTVTRKLRVPLTAADALAAVEVLGELEVAPITRNLVIDATRTSIDHQLSFWDAQIIETASRVGASQLLTEDLAAGSTLRGVTIVDPFA